MTTETGWLPAVVVLLLLFVTTFIFGVNSPFRYYGKFFVYYATTHCITFFYIPFCASYKTFDVSNARWQSYLTRQVAKLIGIEYEVEDPSILAQDRGAFIVSNHLSSLDILGQFNIWEIPYKLVTICKREIFWVWPFGLCAWLCGGVFINRSTPEKAYQTLKQTSTLIKDKTKVWFYVEGTRNNDANRTRKLMSFRRGAFQMAVTCQAPVIPVVFSPYYFIDKKTYRFDKGKITIKALPAVETKGLNDGDVTELMERIHKQMQEAFEQLCARLDLSLPPSHPFRKLQCHREEKTE